MIVFDLGCDQGHVFEAWFGSSADYEAQRGRGLIQCPLCQSMHIEKAPMAPRLERKGNSCAALLPPPAQDAPATVPITSEAQPPEQMKTLLKALAQAQAKMLEGSEYVGADFVDRARAMHLGEVDQQSIHGQSSIEEAQALIEEGIAVMPLPLPFRPPSQDN